MIMSEKKWYHLSENAQDSLVYLLIIIICGVVVLHPLGLPLTINESTTHFYETLENIPEGSTILWNEGFMVQAYISGSEIAFYRMFFDLIRDKNVKIIFVSSCVDGPLGGAMIQKMLDEGVDKTGTVYGTDYVNLGWLPGFEAVLAAIAQDIQSVTEEDAYGTPVSDIEMMKGLTTDDLYLLGFSCGVSVDPWMRQWVPLGKPILMFGGESMIATAMGYVDAGVVEAYLNGGRGMAEFEKVYGFYTLQTAIMDAKNLMSLYGIGLIILSNIIFGKKRS
jgi:hypothetical protein